MRYLALILSLLIATPAYAVVDPVFWAKMDDNTGTVAVDSGSGTNDCTLVNTPTWSAPKVGVSSLSFASASSEYADCTDDTAVDITGNLSITVWVNPTTLPTAPGHQFVILGKGYSSGTDKVQYLLRFIQGGGDPLLQCGTYAAGVEHIAQYSLFGDPLSTGVWYHIACIFNGTTWKVYVDDVQVATLTDSTIPQHTTEKFLIGSGSADGTPNNYFNGIVDDVRLYNRAITSGELTAIAQQSESDAAIRRPIGVMMLH